MENEILDVNDFMERVQNDKELFFELLEIFAKDFVTKRKELETAIENKDSNGVEQIAHFLKGSCGNISVEPLKDIFGELEIKGKANELEGTEKYLGEIDQKYDELLVYIEELRNKIK